MGVSATTEESLTQNREPEDEDSCLRRPQSLRRRPQSVTRLLVAYHPSRPESPYLKINQKLGVEGGGEHVFGRRKQGHRWMNENWAKGTRSRIFAEVRKREVKRIFFFSSVTAGTSVWGTQSAPTGFGGRLY